MPHKEILICGDCNCNVLSDTRVSQLINNKFAALKATHSYNFLNELNNKRFTFSVSSRDAHSLIDFFFLSRNLGSKAICFEIIDHVTNLSDHLPIKLVIPESAFIGCFNSKTDDTGVIKPIISPDIALDKIILNWNVKNNASFYECTRLEFFELNNLFSKFTFDELKIIRPDFFSSEGANTIYKNLMHSLLRCSIKCFGIKKKGKNKCLKWWWDDSLRLAIERSLSIYRLWKQEGFNPDSNACSNYNNAKKEFKHLIRVKKRTADGCVNDKLFNSLILSNTHKFWKL